MAPVARVASPSSSGAQVTPPSAVCQAPPAAVATYRFWSGADGSAQRPVTRPDTGARNVSLVVPTWPLGTTKAPNGAQGLGCGLMVPVPGAVLVPLVVVVV